MKIKCGLEVLMVKVCGYSARFITLSPRFQQEVIERHRLKTAAARAR